MKTFNTEKVDWLKQPMFFGEEPNTQRFDQQKYPIFEKLNQQQLGFFGDQKKYLYKKIEMITCNYQMNKNISLHLI
jgi:hypothetical protein